VCVVRAVESLSVSGCTRPLWGWGFLFWEVIERIMPAMEMGPTVVGDQAQQWKDENAAWDRQRAAENAISKQMEGLGNFMKVVVLSFWSFGTLVLSAWISIWRGSPFFCGFNRGLTCVMICGLSLVDRDFGRGTLRLRCGSSKCLAPANPAVLGRRR